MSVNPSPNSECDCIAATDSVETLRTRLADLEAVNTRLADALRARDTFMANMSHELRTPLNAIIGFTELIQDEIYGPVTDRQQSALATMANSGQHLLNLVNDLLDLAKIEAGREALSYKLLAPDDLARTCVDLVRQMAVGREITLIEQIDDCEAIEVDERRVKQILMNLLSNAIKFTPPGGSVGLRVRPAVETADSVSFSVWDTGIGIEPQEAEQLFRPFQQIENAQVVGPGGAGLGLALVARLAELHGGGIELSSTLNHGSCFTVTLPRRSWAQAGQDAALSTVYDWPRLLLVKADPAGAARLSAALADVGIDCVVVPGVAEAVSAMHSWQPQVVLVDLSVSGGEDFDLVKRLFALPTLYQIPIVVTSSITFSTSRDRLHAIGVADYLPRPLHLPQLLARLNALM